ncbi:hypothetical protein GCM10009624_00160 [Gordonia sinesedis]
MRLGRTQFVVGVLAVLTIAAVAVAGFLGYRYLQARAVEDARSASLEAAKGYATTMFGYDPTNVDRNVASSRTFLTGKAKPQYDELIAKNDFVAEVRKQQIVSTVTIQGAGVVDNTTDASTVLVFMNQSVTRGGKELVNLVPSRLTFTMIRSDGRWMVDNIDIITDDSFRSRIEQTDKPPAGAVPLPAPSGSPTAPVPAPGSAPVPVPSPAP